MAEVRILSHMNKDHKLAIEDYLSVYGNVIINEKVDNIKMTQISLDHMVISFTHDDVEFEIEKPIQFDPALENLSEARVRLVEMAKYAAEKRGYAHFQIADYKYPAGYQYLIIAVIYLPLLVYLFPVLADNHYVSRVLSQKSIQWLIKNSLNIVLLTLFIHATEAYFILMPKLEKYRVPTDYRIEWYIAELIEGFGATKRFNALVSERLH